MRALLLALALAGCHPAPGAPSPATATTASKSHASDFGFYLLAMSWTPSFCCTEPGKEQCANLAGSFAATHLTLHGLWPNFTDEQSRGKPRAWPQFCGAYDHCEKAEDATCAPGTAVPAGLARLAPGYVTDGGALATHEWSKHGSCTALDASGYFAAELAAITSIPGDATPATLGAAAGKDLARDELQRAFGIPPESVVLGCDAQCRLTQVGFCIAKDVGDHPTTPTPCTQNVTTSDYDNGCVVRGCARVAIQAAGACAASQ
jgi:ribonuclease T2